ncbi:MAG: hypothetical protein AAGC55_23215, partial [Myxococcota bacterium]
MRDSILLCFPVLIAMAACHSAPPGTASASAAVLGNGAECAAGDFNAIDPATQNCYMVFFQDDDWRKSRDACSELG